MPTKSFTLNGRDNVVVSSYQQHALKRKNMLDSRIYASDEAREYAKRRADEVNSGLDPKFPSFVKHMTQSHVTGGFWLGLPRFFCTRHLPKVDTEFILIDENLQSSRTLYLAKKTGLSAGWRGFSVSHRLVDGDAVVFHLVESTTFKVYILRASSLSCAEGDTVQNKQQTISYRKKVKWQQQQAYQSSKTTTRRSSTSVGTQKPSASEDSCKRGNHDIHQNTDHKVVQSKNQKMRQEQGRRKEKGKQEANFKLLKHMKPEADSETEKVHVQCSESSCKGCSCEAREYVVLKAKELQSGLDSQFPSFIKLMEQFHVSGQFWLEFPTTFCEKYLSRENTKMTLIDENLDTFKTLFLPHRSGLTLGWQEFCISHKLVQGDALIFHLANPTTFKFLTECQISVYTLKAGGFPCASLSNSEIGSKKIISRPTTTREAQLRRSTRLSAKSSTQCTSDDNQSLDAAVDAEHFSETKDQEGEAVVAKESNLPPTDKCSLCFESKKEIKCKEAVEEHRPLCKICMEGAICMLLLPRKHLVLCKICDLKLSICPICNSGKVSSVEVFLS